MEEGKKAMADEIKRFLSNSTNYVEEVVKNQEIQGKVSDQIIKQMETESMQKVLEDYAKKAVGSQTASEIFDQLRWMVDEAFVKINEKIDKTDKELPAKMGELVRE